MRRPASQVNMCHRLALNTLRYLYRHRNCEACQVVRTLVVGDVTRNQVIIEVVQIGGRGWVVLVTTRKQRIDRRAEATGI